MPKYGRVKHKLRERIGSRTLHTITKVGRAVYDRGDPVPPGGPRANPGPLYQAYSCLAKTRGAAAAERARGGNSTAYSQTCTKNFYARTPQSAIAHSLKALAGVIAKRNRTKRRRAVKRARGW